MVNPKNSSLPEVARNFKGYASRRTRTDNQLIKRKLLMKNIITSINNVTPVYFIAHLSYTGIDVQSIKLAFKSEFRSNHAKPFEL